MHPLRAHYVCACGRLSLETICPLCEDEKQQQQFRQASATMRWIRQNRKAAPVATAVTMLPDPPAPESGSSLEPSNPVTLSVTPGPLAELEGRVMPEGGKAADIADILVIDDPYPSAESAQIRPISSTLPPPGERKKRKPNAADTMFGKGKDAPARAAKPVTDADQRVALEIKRLADTCRDGQRRFRDDLTFDVHERKEPDGTKTYRAVAQGTYVAPGDRALLRFLGKRCGTWDEKPLSANYAGG